VQRDPGISVNKHTSQHELSLIQKLNALLADYELLSLSVSHFNIPTFYLEIMDAYHYPLAAAVATIKMIPAIDHASPTL
jgi:hypothetical protein